MPDAADLIGPYRLVSQLGKGAMGEVWRARDERLDRYVALKVLPAELAGDPERRARIQREARAAAAIRHANVVTLYDIVEDDRGDILVMELVEGRTLADVLRTGKPALDVGLRWIAEIVDGLAAAHARKILHRDIKAANIMVTSEGHIKVLDFGLAKVGEDHAAASMSMRVPEEKIALDATLQSPTSYETHAGQLLGTPLYMAPEQIAGGAPDERSEVFSVGVLAYEIVTGKPPYSATTMDALFEQILQREPVFENVPIAAILKKALAKEPRERYASMAELRAALVRRPARRIWPFALVPLIALVAAIAVWPKHAPIARPGDEYVTRALEEYDVFYNDKALSSLRAALRVEPLHPRANAYMLLFGSAPDRDAALAAAHRAKAEGRDAVLLAAAIAYAENGAAAARETLGTPADRELRFWAAELDYRAAHYATASAQYKQLLAEPAPQFRGRIYDHESSVLLYLDEPQEALRIGTLYRDAFPGEADAVGVYATTLAAAGKFDEAIAAAEDAVRLNEDEDTLAGLAKVLAMEGEYPRAIELYKQSVARARPARKPIRRAALGWLQWITGDATSANATLAPCLRGGEDAAVPERGMCLFIAGVVDPAKAELVAKELDGLAAAATPTQPAYGAPASLAKLVRVRAKFFGGACVGQPDGSPNGIDESAYTVRQDFYGGYHVPLFATYQVCEHAALLRARGDAEDARKLLDATVSKAPGRSWLIR